MDKRTYIAPTVSVVEIEMQNIIASSDGTPEEVTSSGSRDAGEAAIGNRIYFDTWEDDGNADSEE